MNHPERTSTCLVYGAYVRVTAGLPVGVAAGELDAANARVDYLRHVLHCALRDRPPRGRFARHVRRVLLRQGRSYHRIRDRQSTGTV